MVIKIDERVFSFYRTLCLKRGNRPSKMQCYRETLDFAETTIPGFKEGRVYSEEIFRRRLNEEVGISVIYYIRHGRERWVKKFCSGEVGIFVDGVTDVIERSFSACLPQLGDIEILEVVRKDFANER